MAKSKQPTAAWKGTLAFGLISFPVRALTGAREEKISFNQICPEHHCRIKKPTICPGNGVPHTPEGELLKGFEHKKNEFIYVTKQELEALVPETSKTMQIIKFVKAAEVDAVYFDSSYLLCPDEGGAEPFRLVRLAMEKEGWMALAKLVMHGSEHLIALQPYRDGALLMHTLYWASEVREIDIPQPEVTAADEAQLSVCSQLIGMLAGKFDPEEFTDERSAKVRELIAAKVAGGPIPEAAAPPKKAPTMDMMAALQQSLAAMKAQRAAAA
jgi:DNA end-binding protein Ku